MPLTPLEITLMVIPLTVFGLICGEKISGIEIYSKLSKNVTESEVLAKMENIREVECILGCKSFGGCAFASFRMVNKEKHGGNCWYYASLTFENGPNITITTAYIRGNLYTTALR